MSMNHSRESLLEKAVRKAAIFALCVGSFLGPAIEFEEDESGSINLGLHISDLNPEQLRLVARTCRNNFVIANVSR